MCVDDYEFRHFSARREKICRKFIIINQDQVARTFYVNISQFEQNGEVALCKILIYLSTKGLVIENKKFYLPKFTAIIEPYTYCKIIFEALDENQIIVRTYPASKQTADIFAQNQNSDVEYEEDTDFDNCYCRFEQVDDLDQQLNLHHYAAQQSKPECKIEEEQALDKMVDQSDQKGSSEQNRQLMEEGHKKIKESQRGIGQVIKAVKIWRELHQSKRCNLTNAAKVVGISKKSLDDYFLVLRVGEILGFDYANNLEGKMGDLRNFIRHKQQKITGKLGKNVECFKLVENCDLDQLVSDYQTTSATVF